MLGTLRLPAISGMLYFENFYQKVVATNISKSDDGVKNR